MTLKQLRLQFKEELYLLYPQEEIESFYFLILEERLQLKRVTIALNPEQSISEENSNYFSNCITQLKNEIPLQYILGVTEFFGLPFKVTPDTLIPRPETEELVAWIIDATASNNKISILDIGTGSGCIAISLAKNIPNSKVSAIDISEKALKIANYNANLHKVSISFEKIDILKATTLHAKFDIIVSNPPYVRHLEKKEIKNNVLENEPHTALFVLDNNPLIFYDKIGELAKQYLKPNGQLFFEINQYLSQETLSLLGEKGFSKTKLRKDIFGNDRMILANI
jgi:release factor glutamine methyltransferase